MNLGCKYIHYEPNECCKCVLLGYHFSCDSQQCKEAIANEKNNKVDNTAHVPHRGRG